MRRSSASTPRAYPGLARLDRAEFERLLTIPNEHLAIEGLEGGLLGYLLAFRSDASYDGEEFLSFVEMASEPFIYIDQVAVDARFRRGSLASTLYSVLEGQTLNSPAAYLCCEVNLSPENPTSLAFHMNRGFTEKSRLNTADGRMVALLTKPLVSTETEARET